MIDSFRVSLEEALEDNEMLAIYTYNPSNDQSYFAVGFVRAVHEEDFTFEAISPGGEPDGIGVRKIEEIVRIEMDTRYLRKIRFLYENVHRAYPKAEPAQLRSPAASSTISEIDTAKRSGEIITLQIGPENDEGDVEVTGFVEEYDPHYLKLRMLNSDGERNGRCIVKIEDIYRLTRSCRSDQRLVFWHEHRAHIYD